MLEQRVIIQERVKIIFVKIILQSHVNDLLNKLFVYQNVANLIFYKNKH